MKIVLCLLLCFSLLLSAAPSFAETEIIDPEPYNISIERYMENLSSYDGYENLKYEIVYEPDAMVSRSGAKMLIVLNKDEKVHGCGLSVYLKDLNGMEEELINDSLHMFCALYMLSPNLVRPIFEETETELKEALDQRKDACCLFHGTAFQLSFDSEFVSISIFQMESLKPDLSTMSYDELVALKDQINLAIWQSDEWQEVEVPQGVWVVGEDIPAGKWTIRPQDKSWVSVHWGTKLNEAKTDIDYGGRLYESEVLCAQNFKGYYVGDATEVSWELEAGQYIVVDDGIAVFTPYSGKPSLGFK